MAWPLAYLSCIALAFATANGLPGAPAPILLAVGLPAAVALSRLRREPFFAAWIVAVIPTALLSWRIAGESALRSPLPLLAVGLLGIAAFAATIRERARVAAPLAVLGLMACLVAYFSSGHGGAGPMTRWLLAHGLTIERAHALTLAFRKTVHFTFYGTVGWTALRAACATGAGSKEAIRAALLSALVVASFDELRQSAYADRTGSAWDVLLDLAGAATFVGLSGTVRRKTR